MTKHDGKIVTIIAAVKNVYLNTNDAYSRIKVCEACDKYLKMAKICGICKCFMPTKTRLRFANCPEDKWEKVNVESST